MIYVPNGFDTQFPNFCGKEKKKISSKKTEEIPKETTQKITKILNGAYC